MQALVLNQTLYNCTKRLFLHEIQLQFGCTSKKFLNIKIFAKLMKILYFYKSLIFLNDFYLNLLDIVLRLLIKIWLYNCIGVQLLYKKESLTFIWKTYLYSLLVHARFFIQLDCIRMFLFSRECVNKIVDNFVRTKVIQYRQIISKIS